MKRIETGVELENGVQVNPRHCGRPMRVRQIGTTWEGNDEIERVQFACVVGCGAVVEIVTRTDVGPPSGRIES